MTGSGTAADPYIIWDVNDLQDMDQDLDAYYELGCDIDASATATWNAGAGFEPVSSTGDHFIGNFDGKGHSITGLYIDRSGSNQQGLFGAIKIGAVVKNVDLISVNITGQRYVGALIGICDVGGTITHCSSSGTITSTHSKVGGLIGYAQDLEATMEYCHSSCDITASDGGVGGLVGNFLWSTMEKCYATGDVSAPVFGVGGLIGTVSGPVYVRKCFATGDVDGDSGVGGLIGFADNWNGEIEDCYARGNVTATTSEAGGLIGEIDCGTVSRCFSTGVPSAPSNEGGLIGLDQWGAICCDIEDSYWDTTTSGTNVSDGGTGKTTTEMKTQSTFTDWDFYSVWRMLPGPNDGYPSLIRITPGSLARLGNINVSQVMFQNIDPIK